MDASWAYQDATRDHRGVRGTKGGHCGGGKGAPFWNATRPGDIVVLDIAAEGRHLIFDGVVTPVYRNSILSRVAVVPGYRPSHFQGKASSRSSSSTVQWLTSSLRRLRCCYIRIVKCEFERKRCDQFSIISYIRNSLVDNMKNIICLSEGDMELITGKKSEGRKASLTHWKGEEPLRYSSSVVQRQTLSLQRLRCCYLRNMKYKLEKGRCDHFFAIFSNRIS